MLKKFGALMLSFCLVTMAVMVIPVSATTTSQAIDDFETGNVGTFTKSSSGFWHYASSDTSGLLVKPTVASWSEHLTVASGMGYDSTTGLHMHSDTTTHDSGKYRLTTIMTKSVSLTEASAAVLRYKVKFLEFPKSYTASDDLIYLSCISDSSPTGKPFFSVSNTLDGFESSGGTKIGSLVKDKWYTVVTKVTGAGTTKSVSAYILNEDNTICASSENTSFATSESFSFWPVFIRGNLTNESVRLVVDDISLTEYSTDDTVGLDVLGTNITNGEADVPLNKSFTLAFDQAITAPSDGTVTLYETNTPTNTVSVAIENQTFNSFTVNPESTLASNTSYTLSFSGITSASGKTLDTGDGAINFTTINAALEPVTFTEASFGSNRTSLKDGAAGVGITDNVYLTFDGEISLPASADVTMYKTSDNTSVDISLSLTEDKKSLIVTPSSGLTLNTLYTINFSGVTSSLGGKLTGDTTKLSFTTSTRRELALWQDDFESADPDTGGLPINKYTSDVLTQNYHTEIPYIKSGIGKDGSKGLQIVKETNSVSRPRTKEFALDDTETLYFEFKMNFASFSDTYTGTSYSGALYMWIDSDSNSSSTLRIDRASDGKYYICNSSGSTLKELSLNTWYTFVIAATKTSQKGYLYDENGALICEHSLSRVIGDDGSVYIYPVADGNYSRFDLRMDDFKVYRLSDHELELDSENSSVKNGDTGVKVGEYISLAFNQPLAKDTAALDGTITSAALYNGNTIVDAAVSLGSANELRITPNEALIEGETYTVKFADTLSPLSGNASKLSDISFTMAETYPVKVTGCALSAVPESGALNKGTDITLTLRNSGAAKSGSVIIAALYSSDRLKKLVDFEIFENVTVNATGSTTLPLTLQNSYEGVGSIEFLMYDTLGNFSPLMHSYKIVK